MLNRLEVDRAVFYVLLTRGWQFLAGGVSMLVIARFLSDVEQGLFGMFATLMGLNLLVELGLAGLITAVASHEWPQLTLTDDGTVAGEPQALRRLAELSQRTHRWYAGLALVFTLVVGWGGYWYLGLRSAAGVAWQWPWLWYVALNGPVIGLWSRAALLEGCGQVRLVSRVRFCQAFTGNLVVWPAMILGLGIWAAPISAAVRLAWDLWLVQVRCGPYFRSLARVPTEGALDWNSEIWPLQWRIAVRSIAIYFALHVFALVIYYYYGVIESGQFWLTWTALTSLEAAAFAWVQTRGPLFGTLVVRRDFAELDRVFFRLTTISTVMLFLGGAFFCGLVAMLPHVPLAIGPRLATRLLSPETIAVFVVAMTIYNVVRSIGAYVYAHKRDPFLIPQVIACGTTALLVWWGGKEYGAYGQAIGYLLAMVFTFLPMWTWIFLHCRREWHRE